MAERQTDRRPDPDALLEHRQRLLELDLHAPGELRVGLVGRPAEVGVGLGVGLDVEALEHGDCHAQRNWNGNLHYELPMGSNGSPT